MTFADGSSIIAHYDAAYAPSLVRLHSSRLECEISGTKFADSSSKRRHLRSANALRDVKIPCVIFAPQALNRARFCKIAWTHLILEYRRHDWCTPDTCVTSAARDFWLDLEWRHPLHFDYLTLYRACIGKYRHSLTATTRRVIVFRCWSLFHPPQKWMYTSSKANSMIPPTRLSSEVERFELSEDWKLMVIEVLPNTFPFVENQNGHFRITDQF